MLPRLLDGHGQGGATGTTPTAANVGVIPQDLQWSTSPTCLTGDGGIPNFSEMNEDVLQDALFASAGRQQGGGGASVDV
jgi:hypothetical protein